MNYIYKLIISIISISILSFLVFDTFFTSSINNFENYDFSINNIGKYNLNQNNNEFFLNKDIQDNNIILNQFSKTSDVITLDGDYSINEIENNIEINIEKGLYLFENNEIFKNVIIKGKTFQIDNIGIGNVFINANDENKILIFSINSIIDLQIINPESNDNIDLKIFPHSYLVINNSKILTSSLVKSLNNSDALKISKVLNITFFNEKFIVNNEVNENLLTILSVKQEKYKENLTTILKYLKNKLNSNYKIDISNFKIGNFSKYIDRYLVLFKNDEKKKLYYKNLLLQDLVFLLQTNKINIQIQNEILSNLNKIKELDINEYENSKNLVYYFYLYTKNDLSIDNINIYENFAQLITSFQNIDFEINKNNIVLTNMYNSFDFIEDFNIFYNIDEFLGYYTKEVELNQDNIDYLLMFLENLIANNENLDYNYTKNILKATGYYITILIDHTDSDNYTYLKTNIYNIVELLNNINLILKDNFFEVNRDEQKLLIRNKNTIDNNIISEFKNNFEKLKNYFQVNIIKITSDSNFELLIENYHNIIKSLDEIILALDDNEKYKKEYSIFSNILQEDSIKIDTSNSINTVDKLISYLNDFNGIGFDSKTSINEKNELYCKKIDEENLEEKTMYCFEIKNISITNLNYEKVYIDFLFLPYENNTISDIYITKNNETSFLSRTYDLDYLKESMNEKVKTITTIEERNKYDFTNFFILTFNNIKEEDNVITEEDNTNFVIEESKIVRTFKRNKLLGEEGDFAILNGFFDINYNQLQVTENNETDTYDIKITDSTINTSILKSNKTTNFKINLTGEYIFTPNHSFNNIKLKFINTKDTRTLSYLLNNNTIDINSEIKITDFENTIKIMLNNFGSIESIINNLNYYTNNNSIIIEYFPSENKFKIINSKLIIYFSSGKISEIYYNGETLIENSIDIIELQNILTNLN